MNVVLKKSRLSLKGKRIIIFHFLLGFFWCLRKLNNMDKRCSMQIDWKMSTRLLLDFMTCQPFSDN